MGKVKLDERPARTDLTSRECSKIIGSTIGGLVDMATVENIRAAVLWWAESEASWRGLRILKERQSDIIGTILKDQEV